MRNCSYSYHGHRLVSIEPQNEYPGFAIRLHLAMVEPIFLNRVHRILTVGHKFRLVDKAVDPWGMVGGPGAEPPKKITPNFASGARILFSI